MKILHLETSSKNCSVAISDHDQLLCLCEEKSDNYKQSESLHTFIQWALEGAKISINDIDAVCLGKGPGSYTGLRIGAASAKGLCFGLQIPLISVASMQTIVEPYIAKGYDLIIPLIDARRMEVYTACYDGNTGAEIEPCAAHVLNENSFEQHLGKKILFVGDGAKKTQENFPVKQAEYLEDVFPTSKHLILSGMEAYLAQKWEDVAYFEPFYLKEFHS